MPLDRRDDGVVLLPTRKEVVVSEIVQEWGAASADVLFDQIEAKYHRLIGQHNLYKLNLAAKALRINARTCATTRRTVSCRSGTSLYCIIGFAFNHKRCRYVTFHWRDIDFGNKLRVFFIGSVVSARQPRDFEEADNASALLCKEGNSIALGVNHVHRLATNEPAAVTHFIRSSPWLNFSSANTFAFCYFHKRSSAFASSEVFVSTVFRVNIEHGLANGHDLAVAEQKKRGTDTHPAPALPRPLTPLLPHALAPSLTPPSH